MNEQYYDEHIKQRLEDLADSLVREGARGVVIKVFLDEDTGATIAQCRPETVTDPSFYLAKEGALCAGNFDRLWNSAIRFAREHGHSSTYMDHLGVEPLPATPEGEH